MKFHIKDPSSHLVWRNLIDPKKPIRKPRAVPPYTIRKWMETSLLCVVCRLKAKYNNREVTAKIRHPPMTRIKFDITILIKPTSKRQGC
jgi:hypothetical protein